jgi:site-specific DNA-methyltransferase (adenine-specific)
VKSKRRSNKGKRMEPYYSKDGITIYNADCRKVLPFLDRFDLLLTDPPYGLGDRMKGGTWGNSEKYDVMRTWDQETPPPYVISAMVDQADKAIVWGGNYFDLATSRCYLIWDKCNAVPTMASAELAWTNFDMPVKTFRGKVGVHTNGHPTQKPLELFNWCISLVPGVQTILDPYIGSGTTLVAAKLAGLKAVGIEISEKYCEIAANRLAQGVLQFAD